MKAPRPLGWWDSAGPARTHTKRCANQRERIVGLLSQLRDHPEHRVISEMTHHVLNLAAHKSESGLEDVARQLQKRLTAALNKLAARELSAAQATKELEV